MFLTKKLSDFTADDLLWATHFDLWECEPTNRDKIITILTLKARNLGVEKEFLKTVEEVFQRETEFGIDKRLMSKESVLPFLELDNKGKPTATVNNFATILRKDAYFLGIKKNELTGKPVQRSEEKSILWTDADDARAKNYMELVYGIYNSAKYDEAFRMVISERSFHPVKDKIESITWDGQHRITEFLIKWMKAEDSPYTREVSRLIFAGGIHRLYRPGCKFDYMPVLIGTKQGEGKSTIVRWLNMCDEYFGEVTDFEGQRGIEALEGVWICEVSELLACNRAKELEAVKSYLSRQNDRYRMPFDKHVTDHPRQCIFIGTTNKMQFLTDKTGSRRFYPVRVRQNAFELYKKEDEVKAYIEQCWAEAKHLFDKDELSTVADYTLGIVMREKQQEATEDDYREGLIVKYLEDKKETCILELWQEALHNFGTKPTQKDSREIGLIMQGMADWEKQSTPRLYKEYGKQRVWKKNEYHFEVVL